MINSLGQETVAFDGAIKHTSTLEKNKSSMKCRLQLSYTDINRKKYKINFAPG